MLTGAELLIRALADAGDRTVFGYPGAAVLPAQPDLSLLAQSFGLSFFRASRDAELRGALAGWLGADGPALLEIRV